MVHVKRERRKCQLLNSKELHLTCHPPPQSKIDATLEERGNPHIPCWPSNYAQRCGWGYSTGRLKVASLSAVATLDSTHLLRLRLTPVPM